MEIVYPKVIEDSDVHLIHAVINRHVPIGKKRLLWEIKYPLGKIDLSHDTHSNFEITLSTVAYVPPGHTEEYGEKIVSQFVFQSFHALLLGKKNIGGILSRPLLQIEYNRQVLLSTRPSGKKFDEAFKQITASILQEYRDGGSQLKKAHVHVSVSSQELAQRNLWEAAKRRPSEPHGPAISEAQQQRFLREARA